jgi:molybdate transport system regulatory protein
MTANKIKALLALHSEGRFLVGRERIRLLESVAELGSITKAAKATGFSYKTAWDSVNAVNNLLPTPAFITRPGGRSGGGAEVTDEGRRLIATFHRLEERLSRISNVIAEEGLEGQEEALLWAVGVRVSARNVFQTEVVSIKTWPVDVEVTLKVAGDQTILAIVTNEAIADLELTPGRKALALVKSSFIHLMPVDHGPKTGRNWFPGEVTQRIDAEVNSEIHLDIGHSKTLLAVVPRQTAEDLGVEVGGRVAATFDANHVILAVD